MTTCARCGDPLPKLAIQHGDPFCSNACARLAHGLSIAKPRSLEQINAARGNEQPRAPVYVVPRGAA